MSFLYKNRNWVDRWISHPWIINFTEGTYLLDHDTPRPTNFKPITFHSLELAMDYASIHDVKLTNTPLKLEDFSRINRKRCEAKDGFNHTIASWSLSDWLVAVEGELGEAANIVKKLNRIRDGIPGNKETEAAYRAKLARELADAFIYLDLLIQSTGEDTARIVKATFNAKSEEHGFPHRIP